MTAVGSGWGHLRNGGRRTKRSAGGAGDRVLCCLGLDKGGFADDTGFVGIWQS